MMNNSIEKKDMKMQYQNENSITYYANSVNIATNYYDIQLAFGNQSLDAGNSNKLICKEFCKIFMSPQHAKVLNKILTENIKNYEQKFGEIKVPKEISQPTVEGLK